MKAVRWAFPTQRVNRVNSKVLQICNERSHRSFDQRPSTFGRGQLLPRHTPQAAELIWHRLMKQEFMERAPVLQQHRL